VPLLLGQQRLWAKANTGELAIRTRTTVPFFTLRQPGCFTDASNWFKLPHKLQFCVSNLDIANPNASFLPTGRFGFSG
jgi:hypothetical protein